MKIGVDSYAMQARGSATRGIGRYARDLLGAMIAHDPDTEYVVYLSDGLPADRVPEGPNVRRVRIPQLDLVETYRSRSLEAHLAGNPDGLDALLILSPIQSCVTERHAIPRIASVHYDLIPGVYPEIYLVEPAYRACYEHYLEQLAWYDQVLTMSAHARDDLVVRRGLDPGKITVAGAAASGRFLRPTPPQAEADRALLHDLGIYGNYILNVGHEDPRKGTKLLVEAFARLPFEVRSRYQLVFAYDAGPQHKHEVLQLAGSLGMRSAIGDPELLHALGMASPVVLTGWCSDAHLLALYRGASVMAFPSLYEGFGLPILEAMSCGCPVVVGDNSSQPEVVGDAGLLVDASDPGAVAGALERVLRDPTLAAGMGRRGLERAATFTWGAVAERALGAVRGEG